ncbi:hypothetical protein BCV69DRAFT_299320 [Microstroma glucosiphilum]|uniref:Uncharacterized protein n=1 Tax=Pseudomicrostroma glucosiphilum TaxID=1684307 RepID=A0A316U6K8_9BASI|nr:hypothetical protein BCV69DRAFT_299320 [Pseudomicrostroma glucosiphilum]PWN20850.1 hypothetical protein BCV69DRAFT_299320 [Pseudomicrostroma glucosiphilum]
MAYPRKSLADCSFELCRIQPPVRELMHNAPPAMYLGIRGNVTNEEVEQALLRSGEARAQLVAQELMPTVSADANEDPNEITPARLLAMGSCFYWADPQGNQIFPTNHPLLLAEQFGPRRAATNRSTAPIRNRMQAARSLSQGSAKNVTFRLGHPSGLPAQTVALKVERRANAQSVSVCCTYAPRFPTTTTVLGQVPTTLPRLPSWAEIERGYNLTLNVRVVNGVDHNVEERGALARFQVAWLAGPVHVVRSLGLADDVTLTRIETDYRILLNAVNVPDLFGRRGHRIVMTPDNPGWKLSLDPIEALKRQGYPNVSHATVDEIAASSAHEDQLGFVMTQAQLQLVIAGRGEWQPIDPIVVRTARDTGRRSLPLTHGPGLSHLTLTYSHWASLGPPGCQVSFSFRREPGWVAFGQITREDADSDRGAAIYLRGHNGQVKTDWVRYFNRRTVEAWLVFHRLVEAAFRKLDEKAAFTTARSDSSASGPAPSLGSPGSHGPLGSPGSSTSSSVSPVRRSPSARPEEGTGKRAFVSKNHEAYLQSILDGSFSATLKAHTKD